MYIFFYLFHGFDPFFCHHCVRAAVSDVTKLVYYYLNVVVHMAQGILRYPSIGFFTFRW